MINKRVTISAAYIMIIAGSVVLIGWILDIQFLKSVLPQSPTMKANTALCFVLLGNALLGYLAGGRGKWIALCLTLLTLAIAGTTLLQYILETDFGIDQLVFADLQTAADAFPGRMSLAACACFLLLAAAILLMFSPWRWSSYAAAVAVSTISFIALLGYLYNIMWRSRGDFFATMALHTAAVFFVASLGVIYAKPSHPTVATMISRSISGLLVRRLLPTIVVGNVLIGLVNVILIQAGTFSVGLGQALVVTFSLLLLTPLIFGTAHYIQRLDDERRQMSNALSRRNRAYRTLSDFNQTLVRTEDEAALLAEIVHIIVHSGAYARAEVYTIATNGADSTLRWQLANVEQMADAVLPPIRPSTLETVLITTMNTRSPQSMRVGGPNPADPTASLMLLPALSSAQLYAVLIIYSSNEADAFDAEEIHLFSEMANDLAYGMAALRQRQRRDAAEEYIHYQASLIENVAEAIIATDFEGMILSWNKGAEVIYGWTAGEVIGQRVSEILKSQMTEAESKLSWDALLLHGQWRGEVLQTTKSGQVLDIRSTVAVLRDSRGNVSGAVAINRDVTELKRLERARAISEQQFTVVFDEALDVFLIVDSETGVILDANKIVTRTLGYAKEYLIGKHFALLFPPEPRRTSQQLIDELDTYDAVFASQPFLRADGEIVLMDLTAKIIPWQPVKAIMVTLRDVTERLAVEMARVENDLLRASIEQEREVIELREKFIAVVSHEFRTPLAVILSSHDLITHYNLPPEKRENHMVKIRLQVDYMVRLLDDVLTFSKLRSGQEEQNVTVFDLDFFAQELFDQIVTSLNHGKVKAHYQSIGALSAVRLDQALLQHILVNLLSNAIKYSRQDGNIYLDISGEAQGVSLTVRDEGMGIPAKDKPRLFQPFQRASNVRDIKGTGLGLAIVYESVQRLGGRITFESVEGEGTTFMVYLPTPLQEDAPEDAPTDPV